MKQLIFFLALLPGAVFGDTLNIGTPMVPAAPPSAMAHAAYMMVRNDGDTTRELIGVSAEGYAMAHLHRSEEKDGVATMTSVASIAIAPGQTVALKPGGLHIMLMRPKAPVSLGDVVSLVLEFSDGSTQAVDVTVVEQGDIEKTMTHEHES